MTPRHRKAFNRAFTPEKYQAFLHTLAGLCGEAPTFRVAETPVFIPGNLHNHLLRAVEELNDFIGQEHFNEMMIPAISLPELLVPNEDHRSLFLQYDFAICRDGQGELFPQLIEMQGFPSLYFYQHMLAQAYRQHFQIDEGLTHLFSGLDGEEYVELLRRTILNGHDAANVVLLDVEPEKQNTRVDFWATKRFLGVKVLCISDLHREGRGLYYFDEKGAKVPVYRIFNRVIFDELVRRSDLARVFNLTEDVDVEWAGHPNWFMKISKYTLPFLQSPYVPESHFLHQLTDFPEDPEAYVLKPLFSFSGQGVILHPNREILESIPNPADFILQRKIQYAPVVEALDGGPAARCELRLMQIWEDGEERPRLVTNLVRMSRGEMIGVRYNREQAWVGASIAFFENDGLTSR